MLKLGTSNLKPRRHGLTIILIKLFPQRLHILLCYSIQFWFYALFNFFCMVLLFFYTFAGSKNVFNLHLTLLQFADAATHVKYNQQALAKSGKFSVYENVLRKNQQEEMIRFSEDNFK